MEPIKSMTSLFIISSLLLFINHVNLTNAQAYSFGDCPSVKGKENFDLEKFEGTWYLIEKFGAVSKCVRENVTRTIDNKYLINAEMKSLGVPLKQSADVAFTEGSPKSIMKITFPPKYLLDPANYWVMDTDYKNWAVVWSCEEGEIFVHKVSAQIMSRTPSLDTEIRNRIKMGMSKLGIDVSNFIPVDQSDCPWDLDGNIRTIVWHPFRKPPINDGPLSAVNPVENSTLPLTVANITSV